jgi:hypothetical protein
MTERMTMSNEELREWFSKENIPIEQLGKMWANLDKDEQAKKEINSLLLDVDTNRKELEARLRQRIQFGTAGISYMSFIKVRIAW